MQFFSLEQAGCLHHQNQAPFYHLFRGSKFTTFLTATSRSAAARAPMTLRKTMQTKVVR
jgi:hypothetical protein